MFLATTSNQIAMVQGAYGMSDAGLAGQILGGCCQEAMGADFVASCLDNLCSSLPDQMRPHIIASSDGLRMCGRLLRDIVGHSNIHYTRVPLALDYLDILLPCLHRTIGDIRKYYDDSSLSKDIRWRTMYHKMTDEAGGIPLPQRFALFNQYLVLLDQMLIRSHQFDMNMFEMLRIQIVHLRQRQGIELPSAPKSGAFMVQTMLAAPPAPVDQDIHWAEEIFSRPLPYRTPLRDIKFSQAYGPWADFRMPSRAKILFRRWFDQERLSIIVFMYPGSEAPYIAIRSLHMGIGNPLFSVRGIHELCISRDGSCLLLKRWSQSEGCSKLWAVLYFVTWEEMVLFHCTFVALKLQGYLTRLVKPEEFKLGHEKREFQARIIDDDFKHSLIVYRDIETKSIRLHAAVWEGEMRQCPVWTAFVTRQAQSPGWIKRRGKHRIWLSDVQLYVFCNTYRQDHMRQNKSGSFELDFVTEEAASRFKEVFCPASPSTSNSRMMGHSSRSHLPAADTDEMSPAIHGSGSTSESSRGRRSESPESDTSSQDLAQDHTDSTEDTTDLANSLHSLNLGSTDASDVTELKTPTTHD